MDRLPRGKNRSPACTICGYIASSRTLLLSVTAKIRSWGGLLKGNWIFRGIGSGRGLTATPASTQTTVCPCVRSNFERPNFRARRNLKKVRGRILPVSSFGLIPCWSRGGEALQGSPRVDGPALGEPSALDLLGRRFPENYPSLAIVEGDLALASLTLAVR